MINHYQKSELPWRSKTAKEYTNTAKEIALGGQVSSQMRQEQRQEKSVSLAVNRQGSFPWKFGLKEI